MEEVVNRAKELIDKIPYITIASVTPEGEPWNSPVFAAHDENYNFIWNSSVDSQHSKNIQNSGKVFIVIYDSTKEGEGFGIYIEADAKEIEDDKLDNAIKVFYEKKGRQPENKSEFMSPSTRRMYMAVPKKVWINNYDKNKLPRDWREEINL